MSEVGKVLAGILKDSRLGLLLYNIFINCIFLFLQKCDLANCTKIVLGTSD